MIIPSLPAIIAGISFFLLVLSLPFLAWSKAAMRFAKPIDLSIYLNGGSMERLDYFNQQFLLRKLSLYQWSKWTKRITVALLFVTVAATIMSLPN